MRTAESCCAQLDTGELRGQNRTKWDPGRWSRSVTACALVHGAHVHASGAADATQCLAAQLISQNGGTAVVDEDDVHVLRPSPRVTPVHMEV